MKPKKHIFKKYITASEYKTDRFISREVKAPMRLPYFYLSKSPCSKLSWLHLNLSSQTHNSTTASLVVFCRDASFSGKTSVEFKSAQRKKLEESGYRIVGNIGDQWSDILGTNTGNRTFKLPDPMYYIS